MPIFQVVSTYLLPKITSIIGKIGENNVNKSAYINKADKINLEMISIRERQKQKDFWPCSHLHIKVCRVYMSSWIVVVN